MDLYGQPDDSTTLSSLTWEIHTLINQLKPIIIKLICMKGHQDTAKLNHPLTATLNIDHNHQATQAMATICNTILDQHPWT